VVGRHGPAEGRLPQGANWDRPDAEPHREIEAAMPLGGVEYAGADGHPSLSSTKLAGSGEPLA